MIMEHTEETNNKCTDEKAFLLVSRKSGKWLTEKLASCLLKGLVRRRESGGFATELRPLSQVLWIFGLFPAGLRRGRLHYSHFSLLTLCALLAINLPFIIAFAAMDHQNAGQKIQLGLYGFQLFIRSLPQVLTFGHICKIAELLDSADRLLVDRPLTRPPQLWAALSVTLFLGILCGAFYFTYSGEGLVRAATRVLVALIWQRDAQQALLFAFLAHQIQARFAAGGRMVVSQPERCRQAHATLVESVRALSKAFGLRFLFATTAIGYDKLFNVYVNTYFGQNASVLVFYLGALDFIWVIYLPAHFSNKLIEEGNAVQDVILKTPTASAKRNDLKYCYQIDMLLEEVRTSNLEISAWGVFKIDTGIYGSYFNTLLTFFIAMAGFSAELTAMIERYNLRSK